MKYSRTWRGINTLMDMQIFENNGVFTGLVQLFQSGEKIGSWTGGSYGIETEWDTLTRAINSLCIFMIWELYTIGIEDQELTENVAHGEARAEAQTEIRAAKYNQEVDDHNLLIDLEEGHQLCLESIKELNLFHVPKAGPQIDLF